MAKYSPKTKEELQKLVNDDSVNLGDIDTSAITDMSNLFEESEREDFSGIEKWDTSKVTNMDSMFYDSFFNHNISGWDTSSVDNMSNMFSSSFFNQNINDWNVSNVTDMSCMFSCTPFNQSLNDWNVSSVENMRCMFSHTPFNQPLNDWNVSNVTDMSRMFSNSKFNQNINDWNVSSVENMWNMFESTMFNQPLDKWNVSSVINMSGMFADTLFNQPLDKWDTSSVESLFGIFENCPLKANPPKWYRKHKKVDGKTIYCPQTKGELVELVDDKSVHLGDIDTSAITDMSYLFDDSEREDFSGIEKWNVSNVKDMSGMFYARCNEIKLPSWFLKWVENNTDGLLGPSYDYDEILGHIYDADAICKQLKVAYIVKADCDDDIVEVLEKYPSRLQATWALKDKYENGKIFESEKDYYLVIGYEPKEISIKDLEPLVGMDMITADWLLRRGIKKAIFFDNIAGRSYGGTIGKMLGVYNTRLEIIDMFEKPPKKMEKFICEAEGEAQCLGYQPKFEVERLIGRDFIDLMEALRWVEWFREGWETYWWLEVDDDNFTIVSIIKEINGDFDEAFEYKYELPPAKDDVRYILGNNAGEWVTSYGNEKKEDDENR